MLIKLQVHQKCMFLSNHQPINLLLVCLCILVFLRFLPTVVNLNFILAIAGKNLTLSLPQTWALLDGSKSSDDIGIKKWNWYQIRYKSVFLYPLTLNHL